MMLQRWQVSVLGVILAIRFSACLAHGEQMPPVTAPTEAFFQLVSERDRDVARQFYRKQIDVRGMPVVAAEEVADLALQRTYTIVTRMLAGRPDILQAMVQNGMYLIVIGKDQVYTDMPEYRHHPDPEFQNERVRGTGGKPTSFGEENLLSLPLDRYDDESIAVHEFCHTIDGTLRSMDLSWRERQRAAFQNAVEKGLYHDTYARTNAGEYWAEIAQAYFDCNRVNNWNHGPIGTREQLKVYDPCGYELVRSVFQLPVDQDWRYTYLQELPNVTAPPARLQIDPYYTKFTWAREFPVVGRQASDDALLKANDTIRKLFAYRHDVLKALIEDGVRLVVLGEKEQLTDLPELGDGRNLNGTDPLARMMDYSPDTKLIVVGEENILGSSRAPLVGGNQLIRGFAKAVYSVTGERPVDPNWENRGRDVQQYELRVTRLDRRFGERLEETFQRATERGKWRGTAAIHDPASYWAEGVLAYFDAQGQDAAPLDGKYPIQTRESLAEYDPELFALVEETMAYVGKVDWRYSDAVVGAESTTPTGRTIPGSVRPLPLSAVRLTGGPLHHAQQLNARYLLALEPDRMLAGYRLRAGLQPKAESYGGWDSINGKQLTGHVAGHYLSAVSLMYAATGDARFKDRAAYIVQELKEVQDRRGNGYLGAITDQEGTDGAAIFERIAEGEIRSSGFDLNGMWSPWYTLHKMFAGLRDAYRWTGDATALELEVRFAEWAENILSRMSDIQVQRMLNTEFGGMNEIFVDLYSDTGDSRWLERSYQFEHRSFTDPLKRHQDNLAGKHGNTQVPKMLGSLARFARTGDPGDGMAASFFWDRVVQHHSYATGGHGKNEYFGEPGQLNDRVDGRTAETCNVYNMLKLTRQMFALRPDAGYADFHERALWNHILASIDPQDGWVCYMVPVGRGVQHEYERNLLDGGFTCCTASSMESHALHGDGLYYESEDQLWVNLYVPSTAEWAAKGVRLTVETDVPEGESVKMKLEMDEPQRFTLALRRPFWTDEAFAVHVNGEAIPSDPAEPELGERRGQRREAETPAVSSYVSLDRQWNPGDVVQLTLPKTLRVEPLPDNPRRVAILWGPLVLAGDLGPEPEGRRRRGGGISPDEVPVFLAAEKPIEEWMKPIPDHPGCFRSDGVGHERDVDFVPFYRLHRRIYGIYWDLFTAAEWEQHAAEIAAEQERQRKLELATVGYVQPGEMQAERDANMQGEQTAPDRVMGRPGRRGSNWFSFELPVDPAHPMALVVTYNRDEWQDRTFDILVDGQRIAQQRIPRRGPMQFFDEQYDVPPELVNGKQKVVVRFEATENNEIGAVFGLRMIRVDELE